VAAAVIVVLVFAALPHGARVGPVPLAVVPLAPSIVAPPPRAPAGPVAAVYAVRAGDTLWSIAARALGDPFRWQEVWRVNAGRRMNDGSRFVDPDLIRPGWRLSLPRPARGGG
jgi:nucleoid-associated protein YgaU